MWTGSISPVMRQKAKASRPKRNAERRAARRLVLPGFPMPPQPFSKREIDEYFSNDLIQCLICGKSYRRLARHLILHDLVEDEYRDLYGLPYRTGLNGKLAHAAYSSAMCKRIKEGYQMPNLDEARAKAHRAAKHARFQPFRLEVARENISHSNGRDAYPQELAVEVLKKVLTGRTIPSVCAGPGMPSRTWIAGQMHDKPELKKWFLDALEKLDYPLQAAVGYGMQPRFWREVNRRRGVEQSDHQIAAATGVSAMTVNRGRRKRGIQ